MKPSKKIRFQIVKLEERIAPCSFQPGNGHYEGRGYHWGWDRHDHHNPTDGGGVPPSNPPPSDPPPTGDPLSGPGVPRT